MTADFLQARDEIQAAFRVPWLASAPALNGGVAPPIHYDGVPSTSFPLADEAFCRITIRHGAGEQGSLSDASGDRRWENFGVVTVQVFSPLSRGGGVAQAGQLAAVAKNAFQGVATPRQIWFRNARINEVGVSDAWYQVNVLADFRYDEVR